jgi:nucleoside-diphosphate-sugar epimerase
MKILITGANGYIAKNVKTAFSYDHEVVSLTRSDCDLTDSNTTDRWFSQKYFDVVIHTAAVGGHRSSIDSDEIARQNISMYKNLLKNKDNYKKFIQLGSGAEMFLSHTPYGMSKKMIADSMLDYDNFHNLRIFGVFDHNEIPTRFIKSNIIRHIQKIPMKIHYNKIMDFFYMEDLVTLIEYCMSNNAPKQINCSYEKKYTLTNIAKFINSFNQYQVEIDIDNDSEFGFYCGNYQQLPINYTGLEEGIKKTYYRISRSFLNSAKDVIQSWNYIKD